MALSRRALRHTAYLADSVVSLEARLIAVEAAVGGGIGDMEWDEFKTLVAGAASYAEFVTAVANAPAP